MQKYDKSSESVLKAEKVSVEALLGQLAAVNNILSFSRVVTHPKVIQMIRITELEWK